MTSGGHVLLVCTGNVCRSPFAERVLAHQLDQLGIPPDRRVRLASAGTAALVGESMDPRCAAHVRSAGGTAENFRARQLTADMVADADLVLTATREHRAAVARLHPRSLGYAFALRDFAVLVGDLPRPWRPHDGPASTVAGRTAAQAAARRGLSPPLPVGEADIVDPFGRPEAVVAAMTRQVLDALRPILRVLAT
ncbi:MAG TPA: low molecular weight phosphatase family protein [Dermatophilaceae bacterium]|nr:low molecular weight phosphatase family protein [Dermatophilaceae bacterium]